MFKIIIILLIIIPSITSYAYDRNCSRIMDEPFKEYQEEAKDEHSAFYVVVSNDHGCEYGSAIGEKSEKRAKKAAFKNCEKWRKENKMDGKCEPFAINDKIVWDSENMSFITIDGEENEDNNSTSHNEEKYTGNPDYRLKSSNKNLIKFNEQHKLTYKNSKDDIDGRFLYDQEDITDDYQVHVIYILASDSKDKKYDVKGVIEDIVLTGNKYLKSKTDQQQFRLDLTKEGKVDVSFIRVDKTKKKINRIKNFTINYDWNQEIPPPNQCLSDESTAIGVAARDYTPYYYLLMTLNLSVLMVKKWYHLHQTQLHMLFK